MSPSPFVYWAQNDTHVFLKVDLRNVKTHDVAIDEEELEVSAVGTGGQGTETDYHFVVEFFLPVDAAESGYEVTEREIRINLKKKDADWWPRLLYEQQKLPWLKVDFDRWKEKGEGNEEESEDSEDDERKIGGVSSEDFLRTKYPDVFRQLQREELGFITESRRKIYLFCYNLFMFCGFLYVFAVLALKYARTGEDFVPQAYGAVGNAMVMLHLFMFLEVLHPMFGYTKGSAAEAALQVGGRNFVILALIECEPRMQDKPVVMYLFLVYSLVELVRYPYYTLRVYDLELGLLTWLRYTIWIPLYPAGFVCEGVVALRDIPYFEETGRFSVELPNRANFSFSFPTLLRIYLLFFFFPMLYTMMNHMYQLRCKKLKVKQYAGNKKRKDE